MDKTIPFYIKVLSTSASNPHIYFYRGFTRTVLFESFEYSFDNVNWNTLIITDDSAITILSPVAVGDIIYFRVKPTEGVWYKAYNDYCQITPVGCTFEVGGNIMSLFYGGGFTGDETSFITGTDNCCELFAWMNVVDASQLLLPATTLTSNCYYGMFYRCTSLTTAPELPATTLAHQCYQYMFQGCTSLTTVPPIIQATIPPSAWPYEYMFSGCSSLENITIENTNIRNNEYILYGMSPKTIVYKKEGVTTPSNPNKLTVVTLKNTPFNVANAKFWSINGKKVVKVVDSQNRVIWEDKITPLYKTPFYLEDVSGEANEVRIKMDYPGSHRVPITVEYSYDGENWSTMGTTGVNVTISAPIPANSKIYLRSNTPQWAKGVTGENYIRTTGLFKVGGNIMSLLYGSNFTGRETSFPSGSTYTFSNLFRKCKTIKDASDLLLPATTLVNHCYGAMFFGCSVMVGTPKSLPATTLADLCYAAMFGSCTALVSIPRVLPANRVYKQSYNTMFANCPLITTAPEIKATTLADQCYFGMFNGCTALTTAPELPARILADYCYADMFHDCTALTTAPELPARILAQNCYWVMFKGCTNLREIKCLATDVSATDCLKEWVKDVPAGGTFTKKAGVTYPTGDSGIPFGWTVVEV